MIPIIRLANNYQDITFNIKKTEDVYWIEIKSSNDDFNILEEESDKILEIFFEDFLTDIYGDKIGIDNQRAYVFGKEKDNFVIYVIDFDYVDQIEVKKHTFSDLLVFYITLFGISEHICLSKDEIGSLGKNVKSPLDFLRDYLAEHQLVVEEVFSENNHEGYNITYLEIEKNENIKFHKLSENRVIRYPQIDSHLGKIDFNPSNFKSFEEPYYGSEWLEVLKCIKNGNNPFYWISED
jgi:hypothetical protein